MASEQPPSAPAAEPAATTLTGLGGDLLREIFLLLPSLPTLVRAAFACRTFLDAVRSSPAFRRRFSELHAQPLLGIFFDPDGPAIPAFAPVRRRDDPDLRAAVRRGDFFLTGLPDDDDDARPGWVISDCHDGYVVLEHIYTREALAYNPLTLALDLLPPLPEEFYEGFQGHYNGLDYHIHAAPEECRDHGAFRVIYACHDDSRARAAVFSSDSDARAWQVLPYSEALRTIPESGEREHWLTAGRIVDGFVYWVYSDEAAMLVLDTTTLHFSRVDLPDYLKGQTSMFRVGKTRDGVLCVVVAIEFNLYVWLRNVRDDGVEAWVRGHRFQLDDIVEDTGGTLEEHGQLKVVSVVDGVVYFSTHETFEDANLPCWFLSIDLEENALDMLFQRNYDSHVHPYIMPWPRSLVRDKACLQVEGA
ncbi:hypothetical protein CFC21_043544 [Triticum aestivum]|uniref:F-box protein AT5G49610-like beta-propeller domain-containing protein n=3 Tax=Triticum TaxID=4564 RepID=A0A077S6U9_WHEAT|nr:uncharacterized protein LOC123071998 [Triticum aestivum]KAF7032368.1 hypothetical protein CFC21_043544 [Triticum aestivum]CDM85665.1 unnamed protein product [Triticum aestivum]CDM85685.1 unnamed protein product [Triticum aestivum]VAH83654.1 unnamed protein product [Triticum turgidum subsp. durum]